MGGVPHHARVDDPAGEHSSDGGQPLFGYASRFGITQRMKAVCRRAEIDYVSPHQSGRHSYATNALAMGASAERRYLARHSWTFADQPLGVLTDAVGMRTRAN